MDGLSFPVGPGYHPARRITGIPPLVVVIIRPGQHIAEVVMGKGRNMAFRIGQTGQVHPVSRFIRISRLVLTFLYRITKIRLWLLKNQKLLNQLEAIDNLPRED